MKPKCSRWLHGQARLLPVLVMAFLFTAIWISPVYAQGPQIVEQGWSAVGSPGFSAGDATFTSLAFDSHDVPYIAYYDDTNGKATVMSYTVASG